MTGHFEKLHNPASLARAHGVFNVIAGAWPLTSIKSFEWIFGPKVDRWLEYTVSGLLLSNGVAQITAAEADELQTARRIGYGTAITLLAVDLVFVARGRLRWTYLIDAVFEIAWITAWKRTRTQN